MLFDHHNNIKYQIRGLFMKKLAISIIIFLLFCLASNAVGYYGNLYSYPTFDSIRPHKPFSKEGWELERYRREVEEYVRNCEKYVNNAKDDIRRIHEAIEAAIADANKAVDEYNRYMRNGF